MADTKIDCSKVYVKASTFSCENNKFDGAFAKVDIKKGDLVEKGLMRRLEGFNGMNNPYVFTWSTEIPNKIWAIGSGCSTYYNTGLENMTNTSMIRYYEEDRFEIIAKKDICQDEELTHTYKSLTWRNTFVPLHNLLTQ